jgi:S-adenosylmethionine hydrolase
MSTGSSAVSSLITLTTDFGYRDPFAGMMKGVILGINPHARVVDITHGISRHDIRQASHVIHESYRFFPSGAIHVVVVDPGVGTGRRPLIVRAGGHLFVGPDNGAFTGVLSEHTDAEIIHITAETCLLKSRGGATFHGRDLFAPVAAWLSKDFAPEKFGNPVSDPVLLDVKEPSWEGNRIIGEVVYVDSFGNAITNIRGTIMEERPAPSSPIIRLGDTALDLVERYADGQDRKPHALLNSDGLLEIFINLGNASEVLEIRIGDPVTVSFP